jgi:hypothetical protein
MIGETIPVGARCPADHEACAKAGAFVDIGIVIIIIVGIGIPKR